MVVGCQPYAPAAFTPRKYSWYSFLLEAESTSGPKCDRKDFMSLKNPLTPAGMEPASFRFVVQHLNHCATAVPHGFVDFLNIQCIRHFCSNLRKIWRFQLIIMRICKNSFSRSQVIWQTAKTSKNFYLNCHHTALFYVVLKPDEENRHLLNVSIR